MFQNFFKFLHAHVNLWLIHVNVWQKPLQDYKVISLQLIKINGKKFLLIFILYLEQDYIDKKICSDNIENSYTPSLQFQLANVIHR